MYKFYRNQQMSFKDFNQSAGMQMDSNNRWVKKVATILWNEIENKYATLFTIEISMLAKPLQTGLGTLLIRKEYNYGDREFLEQIKENPYYQYFIGLPGYSYETPFAPSLMVEFRQRLTDEILDEINEFNMQNESDNDDISSNNGSSGAEENAEIESYEESNPENQGTLILDATCTPQNISYPQDINLLNKARENLEAIYR